MNDWCVDRKTGPDALYSGVSSFEIPDFVGKDVDEVEEIFERLTELEISETVRKRREVALRPRWAQHCEQGDERAVIES